MAVWPDMEPWPILYYMPFDGHWHYPVDGTTTVIYWAGLAFPVNVVATPTYQDACYFHTCYIDGNQAHLGMNCFTPTLFEKNGVEYEFTTDY